MDSQHKQPLQISKVGRPKSNVLREGLPSKICFLCYGKPLSTYEVANTLYGGARANVQTWMKRLTKTGYLVQVKREVQRDPGKRPKGEKGYQLVASRIVDELDKTVRHNTNGALSFSSNEKQALVDLFDSHRARNLAAALTSPSIRQENSYDLCSMLATILWVHAKGSVKARAIDMRYSSAVAKFVQDQRFVELMSKVAKRLPGLFETNLSSHAETRLAQQETLAAVILFGIRFHNFMAKCSPEFTEKLRWCFVPTQSFAYKLSSVSDQLPALVQDLSEWLKAGGE